MALKILPYHVASESAHLLAEALGGITVLKKEGSRYRPRNGDVIINWGSRSLSQPINDALRRGLNIRILNSPVAIGSATDKRRSFVNFREHGVSIPFFTTNRDEAIRWLHEGEGTRTLVCRAVVDGHEGIGITLHENFLDIPQVPLYTGYIKKKHEYRIHVGRVVHDEWTVIDQVQKVKRRDFPGDRNTRIRNTANGYVFKRNDIQVPEAVRNQAVMAVAALGLDFGAVDVIWNDHHQQAYVLEVNTAPGIEGTTVQKYAEFFQRTA